MAKISEKQKNTHRNFFNRQKKLQNILFNLNLDYELRDIQKKALDWTSDKLLDNKKFIILEMPTGCGKSIYANYVMNNYINEINSKARCDVLTNTKMLQTQYVDEFKYMNNLWGKSNYKCEEHECGCDKGSVINKQNKTVCEFCPHKDAFQKWVDGRISVTNFHIHGLYSLYVKDIIESRNSNLLIVDEAHLLEETINSFVSFALSPDRWKKFFKSDLLSELETQLLPLLRVQDVALWVETKLIPELETSTYKLNTSLKKTGNGEKNKKNNILSAINDILSYSQILKKFISEYAKDNTEWILDKKTDKGKTTIFVQPLWTRDIMDQSIWNNYKHVVLMSATIIDPEMFCYTNGINPEEAAFLKLSSPFPVKNRPIYYYPVSKMTYKNKKYAWENYKPVINKLLKKYEGKKGIIHTGNYEIWDWMKRDFGKNKKFIFASPTTRQEALEEHKERKDDCIIVSPSMMHGVDLKDDFSRFQIILKMPYPSLASKINKRRSEINNKWYGWKTVSDIIQCYGRSIRSDTDYADTIILDACFGDVLTRNKDMFPQYFIDAIKKINK